MRFWDYGHREKLNSLPLWHISRFIYRKFPLFKKMTMPNFAGSNPEHSHLFPQDYEPDGQLRTNMI